LIVFLRFYVQIAVITGVKASLKKEEE